MSSISETRMSFCNEVSEEDIINKPLAYTKYNNCTFTAKYIGSTYRAHASNNVQV
jgi:hypothetical protein